MRVGLGWGLVRVLAGMGERGEGRERRPKRELREYSSWKPHCIGKGRSSSGRDDRWLTYT